MQDTHRFGAFVSLCLASVLLLLSAAVEAGRDETDVPQVLLPSAAVTVAAPTRAVDQGFSQVPNEALLVAAVIPVSAEPEVSVVAPLVAVAAEPVREVAETRVSPQPLSVPAVAHKLSVKTETAAAAPQPPISELSTVQETVERASGQKNTFLRELEAMIHELTNRERKKNNAAPLVYDEVLAANARAYSADMQANNFISHVNKQGCNMTCRFKDDGYAAHYWGENLARWRSSYEPTVAEVAQYFVDEWKASAGHRDNLFSRNFTHEGIGASIDGNEIYVTVHFAEPKQ